MSTTSILKKRSLSTSTVVVENRVGFKLPSADEIDVQVAFTEANKSNVMDSNYRQLISVLKSADTDDEALVRLLKRIKNSAPLIERHNDEVLDCVLRINLLRRNVHVIDAFSQLACDMVFIHPVILRNIVVALLGTFMSPEATSKDTPEREEKLQRLHALLRLLFKLVPTAPARLIEILAEVFPYMKREGAQQASLVGHLLRLTSYIPDHRLELLQLLTHKALQIDLHCPKDEINEAELEDEDDAMEGGDIFEMEKVNGTDSERMQHPLADILDQVLNQFYLHFQQHCNAKDGELSKLDWEKTKVLFKDFLTIFDKIVLPTHKCCHVQFLLFYLCSFRPAALAVAFLDYLWKKVQNPATSCIVRQASAFYIGSFLARAKYVPLSTVCDSLSLMCQWAHGYMASLNDGGFCQPQHDVQRHGTFYAVCQTVFYVFAFHHKGIADGEKGLQYLRDLNLEALVMCPLNPLKACLPGVVKQFASIARHYQLVYCYSVIERNQRLALPTAGGDSAPYGDTVLDAFFPFDPYVLKRTGKWIDPLYRKFEKSDDDDDADLDDEPEDDDDELMCKSPKSPSCVAEMFSYGTSPGFKRSLSFGHHR